ncbi:MAG TPA: hypothetical protein VM535_00055 [Candidatus Saccharimonadales bacterium]|nr:hypothetical protein [Candidatus Saccharimonadales bacterium]
MKTSELKPYNPDRLGASKPSTTRVRQEAVAGRTAANGLNARFREQPTLTTEERQARRAEQKQDRRLFRRQVGALAVMAAATLAISANGGVHKTGREIVDAGHQMLDAAGARVAPGLTGHTYSQDEIGQLQQRPVTVQAGEGADNLILDVPTNTQSDIFSDGPDLAEVRQYIDDQHPGVLQPGERVEVPVLPADGH